MLKSCVGLLAVLALSACPAAPSPAKKPVPGDIAAASSVELCRTTLAELQQRLGPPSRDGFVGDTRVLTWVVEWDPLVRYLGVVVDDRGVVVDRYWNAPSEIQWVPTNRCKPGGP